MSRAILAISGSAAGFLNRPVSSFGASFAAFRKNAAQALSAALFRRYRPERHYMRGPGPAWMAKHGGKHGLHGVRH